MTFLEKTVVRRGHPRNMIIGIVGLLWVFYFLWIHNWLAAVAAGSLSVVFGRVLTWRIPEERLAETIWGKMMILHLHPANALTQLVGVVIVTYGIWIHSTVYAITGASLILLGHLWGWSKVSNAL